jgi:hypothetical protein
MNNVLSSEQREQREQRGSLCFNVNNDGFLDEQRGFL